MLTDSEAPGCAAVGVGVALAAIFFGRHSAWARRFTLFYVGSAALSFAAWYAVARVGYSDAVSVWRGQVSVWSEQKGRYDDVKASWSPITHHRMEDKEKGAAEP